jgi:hypothetical protein
MDAKHDPHTVEQDARAHIVRVLESQNKSHENVATIVM